MSEMKQYVILGLGIFGSTIAKTLSQYNHEVIAIDKDLACVDRVSDFVTQAIQADFTDIDQLRAIGIQDCDAAVVATGSHLEESIMGVMNLRELGIPFIMAKAKNKKVHADPAEDRRGLRRSSGKRDGRAGSEEVGFTQHH